MQQTGQSIKHTHRATLFIDPTIHKHIQSLQMMNQYLQASLEPALRPHIVVANMNENDLFLETTTAVWAMAIRYRIPDLIHRLQEYPIFKSLNTITCYIKPASIPKQVPFNRIPRLSPKSSHALEQLANTIGDLKLREALLNIARHKQTANPPAIKPNT